MRVRTSGERARKRGRRRGTKDGGKKEKQGNQGGWGALNAVISNKKDGRRDEREKQALVGG